MPPQADATLDDAIHRVSEPVSGDPDPGCALPSAADEGPASLGSPWAVGGVGALALVVAIGGVRSMPSASPDILGLTTAPALALDHEPRLSYGYFLGQEKPGGEGSYATEDAIDLAYAVSKQLALMPARNVILAVSASPRNLASQERLRWLKRAGARVVRADPEVLLAHMKRRRILASVSNEGPALHLLVGVSAGFYPDLVDALPEGASDRRLLLWSLLEERSEGLPPMDRLLETLARRPRVSFVASAHAPDRLGTDPTGPRGWFTQGLIDALREASPNPHGLIDPVALTRFLKAREPTRPASWARLHAPERDLPLACGRK